MIKYFNAPNKIKEAGKADAFALKFAFAATHSQPKQKQKSVQAIVHKKSTTDNMLYTPPRQQLYDILLFFPVMKFISYFWIPNNSVAACIANPL